MSLGTALGCGTQTGAPASGPGPDGGGPIEGGAAIVEPGEPDADARAAEGPSRPTCAVAPISEGDLQNQASGPSVFGQVVGGDVGWFDTLGGTECGLADVQICVLGTDLCTDSDAAGQFVLGELPEAEEIEVSFEKEGHNPALRLVRTSAVPINLRLTRLIPRDGALGLLDAAGIELDETRGTVLAIALVPGEGIGSVALPDNVVMTLEPGGQQPIYSRGYEEDGPESLASDELDPTLEATRAGGWGLFANVEPGDYGVRIELEGQLCSVALPGYGYGVDDEGSIRVKVVSGYQTASIAAFCQ